MRCRGRRRAAILLGLVAWACAPGAAAQDADLQRVDSLTDQGRVTLAREALQGWWDREWDGAERQARQRALWLRGKLTVDPSQARRDYQRLVLEYPGGPYAAQALLRLGRAAEARGRLVEAAGHFDQLIRDYPNSPHRLEARRWRDEHGAAVTRAVREGAAGGEDVAEAAAAVPSDEDVPDEDAAAEDTRERSAREEAGAEEAGSGEPAPESRTEAEARTLAVQLGAFGAPDRARALARRARARGLEIRLVRVEGSDLVRVRAGRFASRGSARDLRARIRGMDLEAFIVTDADRESPIQ